MVVVLQHLVVVIVLLAVVGVASMQGLEWHIYAWVGVASMQWLDVCFLDQLLEVPPAAKGVAAYWINVTTDEMGVGYAVVGVSVEVLGVKVRLQELYVVAVLVAMTPGPLVVVM